jgi:hypothetical protein
MESNLATTSARKRTIYALQRASPHFPAPNLPARFLSENPNDDHNGPRNSRTARNECYRQKDRGATGSVASMRLVKDGGGKKLSVGREGVKPRIILHSQAHTKIVRTSACLPTNNL